MGVIERVTYSRGSLLIILLLRTAVLLVSATDRSVALTRRIADLGTGMAAFYNLASNSSITLLRATRGARNPNVQVVITHASLVCSQLSFGLPLRMNRMHRTQFDHACFDRLSRENYAKHTWRKTL